MACACDLERGNCTSTASSEQSQHKRRMKDPYAHLQSQLAARRTTHAAQSLLCGRLGDLKIVLLSLMCDATLHFRSSTNPLTTGSARRAAELPAALPAWLRTLLSHTHYVWASRSSDSAWWVIRHRPLSRPVCRGSAVHAVCAD